MGTVWLEPLPREPISIGHERDLLCRRVNVAVVHEFSGWKELIPVILLVVSEEPDELLHFLVDPLGLNIGLQVVGHGCHQFDADEVPELHGELCDKLRSPVGDVLLWCTVELPDIPVVQPGSTNRIEPGGALNGVPMLTEDVNLTMMAS